MKRSISDFATGNFDLVIIGAGITGACLALDATLRGMSVALIDKNDFGSATSAASSKLLHGGIRYLQSGQIHKVRESALERARFQSLAPHLTRFVPFIIPTYNRWRAGRALLTCGMVAYGALCLGQNRLIRDPAKKVPGWRFVGKRELEELIPDLDTRGLTGGMLFHESHMQSSERMTVGILGTAVSHGAVVANYLSAEELIVNGTRVCGVRAKDMLSGAEIEIRGKVVVNAAGPWIPLINGTLRSKVATKIVTGLSKGAHIVTRSLTNDHAIALVTRKLNQGLITRGGRHVFIIPWRSHSLIGTSYGPFQGDPDTVCATEGDITELLEDINSALGRTALKREDVVYAYAGLYPLIEEKIDPSVYQGTGEYRIVDHELHDGFPGFVSVFGAKYTTARLLAEKALDVIVRKFHQQFKMCQTRRATLATGDIADLEAFRREKAMQYAADVSAATVEHLIANYGTDVDRIMARVRRAPETAERLAPDREVLIAEIEHAVDDEMACHLDDFVFRRTGLGTLGNIGTAAVRRCAERMGAALGWGPEIREQEIRRTMAKFVVPA